jgi:hypothetical protein
MSGHGSSPDGCAGSLSECEHNQPAVSTTQPRDLHAILADLESPPSPYGTGEEFYLELEAAVRASLEYPPGTPMVTNAYESYPAVVTTPPSVVAGHRVLAWAESTRRDGEYPGGIVLAVSAPDEYFREYVTWYAYTRDGGRTWTATAGHYKSDYTDAWASFTERAQTRPATGY